MTSIYDGLTTLSKFASSASNIESIMEIPVVAKIFGNSTNGISFNDVVSFVQGDGKVRNFFPYNGEELT